MTIANGFFAGTEIAVLAIRKTRLRELAARRDRGGFAVGWLRARPERFLATVQIGITVIGVAAAVYGGARLDRDIARGLRSLGITWEVEEISFVLVVLIISYLSIVVGELIPKSLALKYAEGYSLKVSPLMRLLAQALRPVVWLLTASSNAVLRIFGDRTTFTESRLSPDELQQLVEESAKAGTLDPRVGEIASRAFDFSELKVSEVMLPSGQIVALRRHATPDEVQRVLLEEGHSRMPVYEGTIDHIVGYVVAKDVLALAWESKLLVLEDILRPAYIVPLETRAVDVLQQLQRRHTQMAIVRDEQAGVVAGLVTIEDLVEELIGEIFSEHEVPVQLMRREEQGTWIVQGNAPLRDVNRELGLALPTGEGYSTIAGACIELAGFIPQRGTKLSAPDGSILEVVDASARRVRVVRIHRRAPEAEATE